jgi:phosphatidate cytidylyltransferase
MASELTKRVAVAAVGIPIAVAVLWLGGAALMVLLMLIAALGAGEFIRIASKGDLFPPKYITVIGAAAFVGVATLLHTPAEAMPWYWLLTTVLVIASASTVIWTRGVEGKPLGSASAAVFAVLLTGGMLSYAIFLREGVMLHADAKTGFSFVAYPLAVTWINDTFAYFGGRSFGKHKLIARVSPGKTVEGTISGLIGSILTSLVYTHFVFANTLGISIGVVAAVIGGVLLSIAAVVGDLAESLLKREAGVKDSGTLLPGHGGVLDRFDALYFTLPVAYWFLFFALQLCSPTR